jgi:carbonic anhydrase
MTHPRTSILNASRLVAAVLATGVAVSPTVASEAAGRKPAPARSAAVVGGPTAAPPAAPATSPAPAAAQAPAQAPAAPADPLDHLRDRLAEKLGAVAPAGSENPNVVRVVNRLNPADPGDVVYTPRREPRTPREGAVPARRGAAAAPAAAPAAAHGAAAQAPHWSYSGVVGPQAWGGLQPSFSACASGQRQSPIDIRDGFAVDLEPPVFEYRPSGFRVIDNGHTVQVNVDPGNTLLIRGRRYELQQFHFHRPSEERIEGRAFDMSAHLVHRDAEGHLAVVAVLLDRGSAQPLVQTVWNHLPLEKHEEFPARVPLDLTQLLPEDRRYYTYMGSLTTPPCSEGVLWVVMRQPVAISPEQIAIFSRLYPMNARPVQSAAGRVIKQSN